jgi:hypothetical protein
MEIRFVQVRVEVETTLQRHKSVLDYCSDFLQSPVLVCTDDVPFRVQVRCTVHLVLSAATQRIHVTQNATNQTHVRAEQILATIHRLIAPRTIRAHAHA